MMTNTEFAKMLRDLSRVYEEAETEIPKLHGLTEGTEFVFCHDNETFSAACRAFGGGKKDADDDSLIFYPERYPHIRVNGFKSGMCERIVTGTREVAETVIPATAAKLVPAHTEEIVEWRCKPFTKTTGATSVLEQSQADAILPAETRCREYVSSLERKPGCCHNCGIPKEAHVTPEPETPFDQEKI